MSVSSVTLRRTLSMPSVYRNVCPIVQGQVWLFSEYNNHGNNARNFAARSKESSISSMSTDIESTSSSGPTFTSSPSGQTATLAAQQKSPRLSITHSHHDTMALGGWFGGGSSSSNDKSNDNNSSSTVSPSDTPSAFPSGGFSSTSILGTTPSSSSSSSTETKTKLQNAITQQSNLINAKYLITKINENCFEHCVPDPGSSLSDKEQRCLSTCMEKYIEGWNTVSKTYVSRLQREAPSLGMGGPPGAAGKELF